MKDLLKYERKLYKEEVTLIAGVDEVGRGPLVGPVIAAAVILPVNYKLPGLTDSKQLSEKKRNEFYKKLYQDAISIGVGVVHAAEIDKINILAASKLAMIKAISNLDPNPEYLLIDGNQKLQLEIPMQTIVKGDSLSLSIAAASVIAKVTRDSMMYELDGMFPEYGFARHKGYPTKEHLEKIVKFGLLDNYRFTFKPISDLIKKGGIHEGKVRHTHI